VVYSSDTGDITASDMIDVVKSWAAINGIGTSLEIGGDMATVSQVCRDLGSYIIIRSMHHILFNKPSLVSFSQESEVHNNTQSLGESISGVVHDQCSCNFTSTNLEDPQLTCSDGGNMVIFTTALVYTVHFTSYKAATRSRRESRDRK